MPNYIIAYHGGNKSETPEEGTKDMERFQAWVAWVDSLGDAVVNPGTPLGKSKTISSDGVSEGDVTNPLIGYSIVKAESMDAALNIAKGCPYLEMGTVEVAETMEM